MDWQTEANRTFQFILKCSQKHKPQRFKHAQNVQFVILTGWLKSERGSQGGGDQVHRTSVMKVSGTLFYVHSYNGSLCIKNSKHDKEAFITPRFFCVQHPIKTSKSQNAFTDIFYPVCVCHRCEVREQKDFVPLIQEMLFCPSAFNSQSHYFLSDNVPMKSALRLICVHWSTHWCPVALLPHKSFISRSSNALYWWVQQDPPPYFWCKGNWSVNWRPGA